MVSIEHQQNGGQCKNYYFPNTLYIGYDKNSQKLHVVSCAFYNRVKNIYL